MLWLDRDAYVLLSHDFSEYFFNRAGFLKITKRTEATIDLMEQEFTKHDLSPYIFLQSESLSAPLLRSLAKKGYRIADQMSVMELETPSFKVNDKLALETDVHRRLQDWAEVYLESFYGATELLKPVLAILERISGSKDASLVLASEGDSPVGVLALFRTPGLLGTYCVGTRPSRRGTHVASTMLNFAQKLAAKEERKLILQTILSDSVEPMYTKLGFNRLYLKDLFTQGRATW